MKHFKGYLFLALSVFLLSGCFKNPEFKRLHDMEITTSNDSIIYSKVKVDVKNNNFFGITTKDVNYDIFINKRKIGKGESLEDIKLKANAVSTIPNTSELYVNELVEELEFIQQQQDSLPVDFKITGKFTVFNIKHTANVTTYLKPEMFMGNILNAGVLKEIIHFKKVTVVSASKDSFNIRVDVEIKNDFPVNLGIKNMKLAFYSDEKHENHIGNSKISKGFRIPSGQTVEIPVFATTKNFNTAKALVNTLLKRKMLIYVKGTTKVIVNEKEVEIPIKQEIDVLKL